MENVCKNNCSRCFTSVGWNIKLSNRKSPWTSATSLSPAGKFFINQSDSSFMAGMSLWAAAVYCFVQVDTFIDRGTLLNVTTLTPFPRCFKVTLIYWVQRLISLVSCSSRVLFHTLQGSVMRGPVSEALPTVPLRPHTELLSLLYSLQGDEDPWIYAPAQ